MFQLVTCKSPKQEDLNLIPSTRVKKKKAINPRIWQKEMVNAYILLASKSS